MRTRLPSAPEPEPVEAIPTPRPSAPSPARPAPPSSDPGPRPVTTRDARPARKESRAMRTRPPGAPTPEPVEAIPRPT
jgi:hypothetical protein